MRRLLIGVGLGFLALGLIIVARTVLNRPGSLPQIETVNLADGFPEAPGRLAGAIQYPTVSVQDTSRTDTTAFLGLHAFLRTEYPNAFGGLQVETISDLSLLMAWPGSAPALQPVLLMGHLDVVPPGADSLWTVPPFRGVISDDTIWGRGALDDKIGVIAALEAVDRLVAEGFQPRRTLYLAFGHDEEVGGSRGASVIADTLSERLAGRLAVVIDEGGFVARGVLEGLGVPVALVGTAEKGYLTLELSAMGSGGHSSAPPELTSVGRVSRAVTRLSDRPFPSRIDGATRAMFERVGPHMSPARRMVFSNLWLFGPLLRSMLTNDAGAAALVRTTTAATMINGGVKENVLPTSSRAVVNFRILPGETTESVTEQVRKIIDDPEIEVAPVNVFFDPSPVSNSDDSMFRLLETTILETTSEDRLIVSPFLVPGATDSRYFTTISDRVYRFLPIVVGREALETIHGADERIRSENVTACAWFLYRLLSKLDGAEEG